MKQYYEALYLSYRPRTESSISLFNFSKLLYSVNIQDDQSLAFSETVQKISKNTYTASRFSAFDKRSSVWINIDRVTLQHNNEFIMLIFFI